jgi:hypothetical protein
VGKIISAHRSFLWLFCQFSPHFCNKPFCHFSMNFWSLNFFVHFFQCKMWAFTSERSKRWKNNFLCNFTFFKE